MMKRILSLLLVLLMVVSMLPTHAFAVGENDAAAETTEQITQVCETCGNDPCTCEGDGQEETENYDSHKYVFGEYVEVSEDLDTALTITEVLYGEGVSDVRVELCEYAKQFVGNPYVWGGTSLTKGADCSGFVLSVFAKFGVELPHYSVSQSQEGTKVAIEDVLPGDLIFYSNGKQINHVAIYIGNGQVVHASSPKTGIKISKYNYRTPVKYVRILQD